jgi:WD40 repeat protein
LMREWGRFRRWIDSAREEVRLHRRLAAAAREWDEAGREPSYLLRGSNLAQFELLAGGATIALTELEREFVEASRSANEVELARERRQNRRLKGLLAGAVALLALAVIAGVLALVSRSNAQHEAQVALGRQLGAEAVSEPRIDLAMLLARESLNLDRSTQTEGTLLATLLRTPTVIGTFTTPIRDRPQVVKVSPDGRALAVVTNTDVMRLYDVRTHRQIRSFPLGNADYTYVPKTGDLFAFTKPPPNPNDAALVLVNPRSGRTLHRFGLSHSWVISPGAGAEPVVVTRDGRYGFLFWAALNPDGAAGPAYAEKWRLDRSGPSTLVPLGGTDMLAASALPGDRVIVATDERISIRDAKTLKVRSSVRTPPGAVGAAATFSPDGRILAYGLGDGTVHFFDIRTGKTVDGVGGHSANVGQIAFSPDSRVAESGGDDGVSIIWDPRTGKPLARLTGHADARVGSGDFSPDGKTLYTASLDGSVFEWDLAGKRRFGSLFSTGQQALVGPDEFGPMPLAISPDGSRFATRLAAASVGIYSTKTRKLVAKLQLPSKVASLAWSSTGDLAVTGENGLVQLWNARGTPKRLRALTGLHSTNGQPETISGADFSPDGSLFVAGDVNHTPGTTPYRFGTTAVWDVRSGRLLWKARSKKGWIMAVAVSPDGRLVAAAREDGMALVYEARTGRLVRAFKLEGAGDFELATLAFDPDGTLATGSWAGIVQRWNPTTGAQVGRSTLVAAAPVSSIAFDPTGQTFATTGGSDGLAKIWDTKTQQQFGATFPGDPGQWGNAKFTPDGSKLVVVYDDGTGFIWPASPQAWEQHACAVAGRNFTSEEWRRFVGGRRYSTVCPAAR